MDNKVSTESLNQTGNCIEHWGVQQKLKIEKSLFQTNIDFFFLSLFISNDNLPNKLETLLNIQIRWKSTLLCIER